jgi:hypothetical protein
VGWVCTIHLLGSTCASRRVHVMSNVCTIYNTVCTTHLHVHVCTSTTVHVQLTANCHCHLSLLVTRYTAIHDSYTHLFPLFSLFPLLSRHLTPLHTHHFKIGSRGTHTFYSFYSISLRFQLQLQLLHSKINVPKHFQITQTFSNDDKDFNGGRQYGKHHHCEG